MNQILLFGFGGPTEWIVILAVIMLLFGGSKLPQLAKALGQSKRAFKEGLDDADEEARLEKPRRTESFEKRSTVSSLSDIDDDELIAEARRRQRVRAEQTSLRDDDKLLAEDSTVNKSR
jgi:sec-independent protein translocase protein TatA